jgi:hypothetical protein
MAVRFYLLVEFVDLALRQRDSARAITANGG